MKLEVARDDGPGVRRCVEEDHYLHQWPHPKSLPFGYRLMVNGLDAAPDNRVWGCVVMKKPQAMKMRGLYGYRGLPIVDVEDVLVFGRREQ